MSKNEKKTEQIRTINGKKKVLAELISSHGVVTPACKAAGISRSVFYTWYNEDEEFKKAVDGVGDIAVDFAESKLFDLMDQENATAIIFYLKTKGKHRGYIERQEVDNKHDFSVDSFLSQFKNKDVE